MLSYTRLHRYSTLDHFFGFVFHYYCLLDGRFMLDYRFDWRFMLDYRFDWRFMLDYRFVGKKVQRHPIVQPRRNRKQKLSEENKSMAIYSLQHRLHLSVPPLLGCRLSYVRGCVYTRGPVAVKKVCRMCVYTLFFWSQQSCWMRHVLLSPSCYSPFVLEWIPSISIVYIVVSLLCCEMLCGPPLLLGCLIASKSSRPV
jgi:hypothetical protein